jgi:tRNA-modifying protein YgfZ
MNAWREFLSEQFPNEQGAVGRSDSQESAPKLIAMTEHQLLQAQGPDAAKFLQGQCTCDIRELEQQKVLLGAQCNRQGRMLASFAVANLGEQSIGLRLRGDIAAATLTELSRYIVFSKAKLAASSWVGIALLNAKAETLPIELPQPGQSISSVDSLVLHHADGLLEIWAPIDRAIALWTELTKHYQPAPPSQLDGYFVRQGIAEVQAATREKYLPQDFNYQAIQAVNFKKGCYTGQEIVARMQYRGQLKKHIYRLVAKTPLNLSLGTMLFAGNAAEKPVAEVVASAPGEVLVITTEVVATSSSPLYEPVTQTNFEWAKLPYAIP